MGSCITKNTTLNIVPINDPISKINFVSESYLKNFLKTAIKEQTEGLEPKRRNSLILELSQTDNIFKSELKSIPAKDIIPNINFYGLKNINILYPDDYNPEKCNKNYNCKDEIIITDWLKNYNLLNNYKIDKIHKLRPLNFGSYILPNADYENLILAGKFFALFVIIDDDFVETLRYKPEELSDFWNLWTNKFSSASNTKLQNFTKAWLDLKKSYLKCGASDLWCKRMGNCIKSWIFLGHREAKLAEKINNSETLEVQVDITEYDNTNYKFYGDIDLLEIVFRQRIITIGTPFWILLLEKSLKVDFAENLIYKNIIDIASIPTFLVNELMGMPRDYFYKSETLLYGNVALIYKKMKKLSIVDTFEFILKLHDQALQEFEQLSKLLLNELENNFLAQNLIQHIKFLIRGYGLWHQHSDRYKEHILIQNQNIFLFSVNQKDDNPQILKERLLSDYKIII